MPTSQPTTQSVADRRAAEAQVARLAPAHERLVAATRRALRKRLPTACEIVYEYRSWIVISYSPSERGYEGALAIRADADGVKLYFNSGKGLPDPEKRLQGSANARWIPLETAATLARPAVARLIDEALARHRVPFPPSGRGPLTVRAASTKPSRRREPA
jgi:hypothetical protein